MINTNIQNIFKTYGPQYIKTYKLSKEQWKVYNSIINCKTSHLGMHTVICDKCGHRETSLNSCRNRHCPNCQSYAREKWIEKENSYILNCPYFHIVTTVPDTLNEIFLYNSKTCYDILFKATSDSILELAKDPKCLGAKVGITSILHTWGQTISFHPHIHSIVTGGGLTDTNHWVQSKKEYLFKVQLLSSLYRGKFLSMLKQAKLNFPKDKQYLNDPIEFNRFLTPLYEQTWITYIEPPKGSPENVIEYIGRYAFRVAISNERIKDISNGKVTFEYKDYKDNSKIKEMTITAEEFIRRFLMHVLPYKFTKIRHYGLLANRNKKSIIKLCRILLKTIVNNDFTITITRKVKELVCPDCGGKHFSYKYNYSSLHRLC